MAPQILKNAQYTTKSDIGSLGIIYYELLYGNFPGKANTEYELINNIEKKPVQFPYQIPVSAESQQFIYWSLQVNESKRGGWDQLFDHPIYKEQKETVIISLK